jgi:structural maintenance of chromosome 1
MGLGICRKAQGSVLAVEERQTLEKLTREEKTASRTFAQLKDKQEELERRRASLREDGDSYGGKKTDVRMFSSSHQRRTLIFGPLSWRAKSRRTASS